MLIQCFKTVKYYIMKHIGIKSCWRFEKISELIKKDLVTYFKGNTKLGEMFDWWVDFTDGILINWRRENASDIPNCVACSNFVKEGKSVFVLKRRLDF